MRGAEQVQGFLANRTGEDVQEWSQGGAFLGHHTWEGTAGSRTRSPEKGAKVGSVMWSQLGGVTDHLCSSCCCSEVMVSWFQMCIQSP
jgi:hypothetical protein